MRVTYKPRPPHARKVFEGKIFTAWQWEQELYDGSTAIFERLTRRDAATVLGVLPDRRILLVQDEQPDRFPVISLAGGGVEPRENPADAARRELLEETGYRAGDLIHWRTYRPPGKTDWFVHVYIAHGITKIQEPRLEAGERIHPLIVTFEELLRLSRSNAMRDVMLRIELLLAQLDSSKQRELEHALYGDF